MARALYRSRQVYHALHPRLRPADLVFARILLSEAEARLFFAMEKRDQRHALEVARRLRECGIVDRDLLTAALLHDCGKGAVQVWMRVLKVLSPAIVRSFGRRNAPGWRGAAYRLLAHADLGASLAAAAGSSATTVRLIAGRPAPDELDRQTLLVSADDAS